MVCGFLFLNGLAMMILLWRCVWRRLRCWIVIFRRFPDLVVDADDLDADLVGEMGYLNSAV